jgi:hypothetical protein
LVVEAKFGYKINASVSTAWYGTWLGTFVDQLPFAASFSFSEKSQLGLFDNLTAEFNPKK